MDVGEVGEAPEPWVITHITVITTITPEAGEGEGDEIIRGIQDFITCYSFLADVFCVETHLLDEFNVFEREENTR